MFDAAVEAGIMAFLDGDTPPSEGEIAETLESQGVEPWLAQRLVAFLPLAFGRALLPGAGFSDLFRDGPVERRLADEPVYAAAAARAARPIRVEMERIGLRSAEVNAANQAPNTSLSDLVFGPTVLREPLPPAGTGDGGVPSPRDAFAQLLRDHGFAVEGDGAGLRIDDGAFRIDDAGFRVGDFRFDARIFPRLAPGGLIVQVDFEIRHPALAVERLVESFAGVGRTWTEAIGQSVVKFGRGSLHPLISTLLDRHKDPDQVEREPYAHPDGRFDLCLGSLLTMYSPQPAPPFGPALDALLDALRQVPLSRSVHALRVFTCHNDGELVTNEVLLDNEPWPAGESAVAGAPLTVGGGLLGLRLFALLAPA
jgi:hypothetical protein